MKILRSIRSSVNLYYTLTAYQSHNLFFEKLIIPGSTGGANPKVLWLLKVLLIARVLWVFFLWLSAFVVIFRRRCPPQRTGDSSGFSLWKARAVFAELSGKAPSAARKFLLLLAELFRF